MSTVQFKQTIEERTCKMLDYDYFVYGGTWNCDGKIVYTPGLNDRDVDMVEVYQLPVPNTLAELKQQYQIDYDFIATVSGLNETSSVFDWFSTVLHHRRDRLDIKPIMMTRTELAEIII